MGAGERVERDSPGAAVEGAGATGLSQGSVGAERVVGWGAAVAEVAGASALQAAPARQRRTRTTQNEMCLFKIELLSDERALFL